MKARYIGCQMFKTDTSKHFKVFYSTPNQGTSNFQTDDKEDASLAYFGEKTFPIGATPEAIQALKDVEAGTIVDFSMTPDPKNPRFNICTGIS